MTTKNAPCQTFLADKNGEVIGIAVTVNNHHMILLKNAPCLTVLAEDIRA